MSQRPETITSGKRGEAVACRELARLGYAILATRYRTRFGEIDIIAARGDVLAFVEVKARRGSREGAAVHAVSARKRRRVSAMALDYLAWTQQLDHPCRFVVVAIDGLDTPGMTIRVIEDAWTVDH